MVLAWDLGHKWIFLFNFHNLPEIIRQPKITQNCPNFNFLIFCDHQDFSRVPKIFGQKLKIYNLHHLPENERAEYNFQNCTNFLNQHQEFPESKILGRIERNSTFKIICPIFIGLIFLKIPKLPKKSKRRLNGIKKYP
jgi:hypothetical protein